MHWWMVYGALTAGVVTTVWMDKRRPADARGAAVVLAVLWLVWNLSHWFKPEPYSQWFPLMDCGTAAILAWLWRQRYEPWKVLLICLYLAQIGLHVAYYAAGDTSFEAKYRYDLLQNILFIGQLATVASTRLARSANAG